MERNLIHIIDNVKNDQYIYSNCLNIELQDAAKNLIADLKNKKGDSIEYEVEFSNNECEIFIKEQVIQNGWIWNSKNINKLVLYKLSCIKVQQINQPDKFDQTTQTEQTSVKDTFIQTNEKAISKLYSNTRDKDIELSDFFDFKDYKFQDYKLDLDLGNGYSKNPFDPINTNPIFYNNPFVSNPFEESKTAALLKNIWSVPENNIINVIGEKNANPFANPKNELNVEIKRRLALPNFGLRKF